MAAIVSFLPLINGISVSKKIRSNSSENRAGNKRRQNNRQWKG